SIPDNASRLNALTAGEIDLADGINPSDGESIENDAELQLIERPSMNVGYLGLTVTREPFDQKEVRQAMNYAIDQQAIIDAFYEGRAEEAVNPMPSTIEGYNEDIDGYEHDTEKTNKQTNMHYMKGVQKKQSSQCLQRLKGTTKILTDTNMIRKRQKNY